VALGFVILGAAAAAYYYSYYSQQTQVPPPAAPAPRAAAPQAGAEPAIRHPLDTTAGEPATLPTLENSDAMMRDALSGLLGRKSFDELVYPAQLIRRIVATVDNLPRETAPRRVMPVEPVPGAFGVSGTGEEVTLAAANSARYAPYVRVLQTLDSRALARGYADSYPLFQRAYAELGFPNNRFHDRLLEAMDDLIEAPELAGPVKLVRPKVFYQFADAELEGLSAGQKIMLRMGAENSAKVKAKLREIRRELAARQVR
jgi:hypothetical protein